MARPASNERQLAFDFDALEPLILERVPELVTWTVKGWGVRITPAGSAERVAELLGTTRRSVQRWRAGQKLDSRQADRFAVALGTVPSRVWPDWHDRHDEEQERREARARERARRNARHYRERARQARDQQLRGDAAVAS